MLAVSGGSAAYNANGGTAGGSFSMSTAQMPAHTHYVGNVSYNTASGTGQYGAGSGGTNSGSTGSGDGTFRPAASIGKLFQLDTA